MKTSKYSAAGMDFIRYSNNAGAGPGALFVNCPNLKELGNKIYFEFDINTTWNGADQMLYSGSNGFCFVMVQRADTSSNSSIAITVGAGWAQEQRISKIGSGTYGLSYDPSGNNFVFYYNSSAIGSITGGHDPIYVRAIFNIDVYQHIFRNEFANIPDGYTVLGDYMGKEAYKNNDYIYTYK